MNVKTCKPGELRPFTDSNSSEHSTRCFCFPFSEILSEEMKVSHPVRTVPVQLRVSNLGRKQKLQTRFTQYTINGTIPCCIPFEPPFGAAPSNSNIKFVPKISEKIYFAEIFPAFDLNSKPWSNLVPARTRMQSVFSWRVRFSCSKSLNGFESVLDGFEYVSEAFWFNRF